MTDVRPVTLLIAAMGGEGGGVLTDWILNAAREEGLVAQNTAIPGVAQRTGATTYYLEIYPERMPAGAAEPVMSIYPQVGDVDIMVATELVEAGRACQNGYVTPDRTTLIASTVNGPTVKGRPGTIGVIATFSMMLSDARLAASMAAVKAVA